MKNEIYIELYTYNKIFDLKIPVQATNYICNYKKNKQ